MKKNGDILAVDAGGTKVHVAVFRDGQLISGAKIETLAELGAEQCISRTFEKADELVRETGASIRALGLASPGVVHPVTNKTAHTWNIPQWDDYDVKVMFEKQFGVPVAIENDGNMAAIAEHAYGNHGDSLAFFAVGTGFGGGLILNRRLWRGANGGAGEVARLLMDKSAVDETFNYGHLESMMSGFGFEERYFTITGKKATGGEIARFAKDGDAIAEEILHDGGIYVGMAAANIATLLDLDAIVLGGGVLTKDPERWIRPVQTITQKFCLYPPKIAFSNMGDEAVLLGSAVAAYEFLEGEAQ